MKTNFSAPAVVIGLTTAVLFFTASFFNVVPFFTLLPIISIAGVTAFLTAAQYVHHKKIRLLCFVCAGVLCTGLALHRLAVVTETPRCLVPLQEARWLNVEFREDPKPAGDRWYRASVEIQSMQTNDGTFSVLGQLMLFIPAEIITAQYSGGITLIRERRRAPASFFSAGARIAVHGRYAPSVNSRQKTPAFFAATAQPEFHGFAGTTQKIRAGLRFSLMRVIYDWGDAGGLLFALLSGNRDFLSSECADAFRNSGLAHILALSGMHLAFMGLLVFQIGNIFGGKRIAIPFSVVAMVFFVWFAGASPSLIRALGMALLLVFGKSLGLHPPVFSVLCAVFLGHVLLFPLDAFSLGFRLSYAAVAGIVLFSENFTEIVRGKIPDIILLGLSVSLGAFSMTTPLIVYSIGVLAPIGIVATLVAAPLASLFLALGMGAVIISSVFPPLSDFFGMIIQTVYAVIFFTVRTASLFPRIIPQNSIEQFFAAWTVVAGACFCWEYAYNLKRRRLHYAITQLQFSPRA